MYRIRFHGRGGQGIKTAARILGTAFLKAGFEVQDAPRYGAERRGAPMQAYVRADRRPINERGLIRRPDLVVVADETLVGVPAAGVMEGLAEGAVLLIDSGESAETWRRRLAAPGPIVALPVPQGAAPPELPLASVAAAAAAAHLIGVIDRADLEAAVVEEVGAYGPAAVEASLAAAWAACDRVAAASGLVPEGRPTSAAGYARPQWVELTADPVALAAPTVEGAATSVEVRTGLWRVYRPVIDYERCNRCVWVCGSFCPDSAILVRGDGYPEIDYEHCKGCMICVVQCPPHAIETVLEAEARRHEQEAAS
jgi:pyruvate ferredoxin oxidoreductase gamma subunit